MSASGGNKARALQVLAFGAFIALSVPAAAPYAVTPVALTQAHTGAAAAPSLLALSASASAAASRKLLWAADSAVSSASFAGAVSVSPMFYPTDASAEPDSGDYETATVTVAADGDDDTPKDICDDTGDLSEAVKIVGTVAAWVSAALYIWSRIPQIAHNHRRKSTEGLSLGLFLMACMANIFYGFSILLPDTTDFNSTSFWQTTFAYLMGSLGTTVFGVIILGQMYIYRHNKAPEADVAHSVSLFRREDRVSRSDANAAAASAAAGSRRAAAANTANAAVAANATSTGSAAGRRNVPARPAAKATGVVSAVDDEDEDEEQGVHRTAQVVTVTLSNSDKSKGKGSGESGIVKSASKTTSASSSAKGKGKRVGFSGNYALSDADDHDE